MRRHVFHPLLAAVLLFGSAHIAAAQSNLSVYGDSLGADWADWSWDCTRDFNNSSPKYSGTKSISVTYLAWGALSLYHPATTLTNCHYLEFYVNAGTNVSMDLQVYLQYEGVSFTALRVTNYVSGKTLGNTWKRALIPMTDFNCTSGAFTRINWKEPSGKTWGAAYLDAVTLINTNTPAGDTNVVDEFAVTSRFDTATSTLLVDFSGQTAAYYQVWAATSLVAGTWSEIGMALGTATPQSWTNLWTNETTFIRFSGLLHRDALDFDDDGLSDVYELQNTPLNPMSAFSDADSLPDGWEVLYDLIPTATTGNDGDDGDPDGDGRSNAGEYAAALNPQYVERNEVPLYLDYGTGPWYHDGNGGGWIDPSSTSYVLSNQYAMRVGLPSNNALAILRVVASNYMDTTGFTNLEFWINGGATNNHKIYMAVRLEENTWPGGVPLEDYVTVQSNTWSHVQIPLAHLGAANVTNLAWVFFKNTNATAIPLFSVDNVKLLKPWPPTAPVISVNASNAVSSAISRRMFGVNVCTWDTLLTNSTSRERMSEAGLTMLRFPGGSAADTYDWQKNTNKTAQSWYAMNTSNFIALADTLGAEKNVTINYGSGSVTEASNWVKHVFGTLNRTVEWWCVGNESYASWEYDTNNPAHDAVKYAALWRQYRTAMTNARPGIKVGVAFTYGQDDFTNSHAAVTNPADGTAHCGWSAVLLHELSNSPPDFVELHFYGYNHGMIAEVTPERANDNHLLRSFHREQDAVGEARKMLCDYLGGPAGSNVAIHITENNSFGYNIGKQTLSLVNALYAVEQFAQACVADAGAFVWWDLHNGIDTNYNTSSTLYGWRNYGDYGILASSTNFGDAINERYPVFYAFKLLTNFARPGDHLVEVTNSYPDILHTYACIPPDTGSVRLLVVNTSPDSGLRPTISLEGFSAGSSATAFSYGITNDLNRDDITVTPLTLNPTNIQYTFPHYSMTVIRF
ncbi:MAG TPA: hypothetical protein PLE77_00315 [Kiritimatiellia bacterium]|nr:hypothetical protein [Kiritimatiellia bacterium]